MREQKAVKRIGYAHVHGEGDETEERTTTASDLNSNS